MKITRDHFRGCHIGGAVGDARGYGVKNEGKYLISDNTQMTCFTIDALIWADDRAIKKGVYAYVPCLFYSYQKWYYTQTSNLADPSYKFILNGEILDWEDLFARRGTGPTTLNALGNSINNKYGTIKDRINNSKGCGSVMRVAPIGLYFWKNPEVAFRIGAESGALTHGHIDAILAAGFFANYIANIIKGDELVDAAIGALNTLVKHEGHENCEMLIRRAISLAGESGTTVTNALSAIGGGYTADEAVALAVYLSLRYVDDFDGAINVATSFDGNTDSIPPITGNVLGAYNGVSSIPKKWVSDLELLDLIIHGSDLLLGRVDVEDDITT